jgi:hypothetical protein
MKEAVIHLTARVSRASYAVRVLILFACLGMVLYRHTGAYAGSSDTSGYMNDARLLADGELHPHQRAIGGIPPASLPFMGYIPLGFLPLAGDRMYPTYPMGMPLCILLGSIFLGWGAGPSVVIWLHAMACLAATLLFFRQLKVGRELSLLGAMILGTSPLFLFMSLQTMSDTPATLWATLTVLACLRSSGKPIYAALAGVVFSYALLVRPTALLMAFPVVLLLPPTRRHYLLFIGGAAPVLAGIAALNRMVYGSALATGYGNVYDLFGVRFLHETLLNYVSSLPKELTPLVALIIIFPFVRGGIASRQKVGLWLWILALFGFYSVYFCTHETWWYLRFVLPAFPPLIAIAMLVLSPAARKWPHFAMAGWILLAAGILAWNANWTSKLAATAIGDFEQVYPETCDYLRLRTPPASVVMCMQASGAVFYYTNDVIVRSDSIGNNDFMRIAGACEKSNRSIYMVLFPFERDAALARFSRGRWQLAAMVRDVGIYRLAGLK